MALFKHTLFVLVLLSCGLQSVDFAVSRITADPLLRAACKAGLRIDERDRRDVVVDLRKQDPNWFPAIPANTYLENRLNANDSTRLVPLGGVSNTQVVGCNDSGYFSTFSTDPYGFNNPANAWEEDPQKKVFFVGDSFAQGDCRRQGESIVDRVRAAIPGVINLGSGGNGPLLELAGIREYVPSGKVAQVFWLYFEGNDLQDLERDKRNEVLVKYLDPQFSQNLRKRQAEVNDIVRRYVEKRIADYIESRPVLFPSLRTTIWREFHEKSFWPPKLAQQKSADPVDIELFGRVLARAKADVEAKGGQLIFVYLPEYSRFAGDPPSSTASHRTEVLSLVANLQIKLIDIDTVFRGLSDPLTLYPFRLKAHYNPDGTRLVARTIEEAIH